MTMMNKMLSHKSQGTRFSLAIALCLVTTLIALPVRDQLDVANIVMLFLLAVFVTAVTLGRGPAILAAFLNVALFDFFFVLPHLSFAVADVQYLVTFAVMLVVGLITSHLVARVAERTQAAQMRERQTLALYDLARDLGASLTMEQVTATAENFLHDIEFAVTLLVADTGAIGKAETSFHEYGKHHLGRMEQSFAHSAYAQQMIVETDTLAGMGVAIIFLPLAAPTHEFVKVHGVLAVTPQTSDVDAIRMHRPLLEAVASLVAMTVERLHHAEAAHQSALQVAAERLRNSILSSLSHDLRTPLTTLVGLADTLVQSSPSLDDAASETATIIRDQAHAMHRLLSNLLEMARLKNGQVKLNRQWQPFEEIIGSSTRLLAGLLANRALTITLPRDLPLLNFDAVLMERVVCNLLENAVKYSATGARIHLSARTQDGFLEVSVCNDGVGFPPDSLDEVFELFVRGEHNSSVSGTGMGLAICKAVVLAHEGTIVAENCAEAECSRACVRFTLPLGVPPAISEEASV